MAVLVACAVGVAIGLMLVWANARAAITIAVVEIVDGKLTVTRGGLFSRVLDDLRDVASRPRVEAGNHPRSCAQRTEGASEVEGDA